MLRQASLPHVRNSATAPRGRETPRHQAAASFVLPATRGRFHPPSSPSRVQAKLVRPPASTRTDTPPVLAPRPGPFHETTEPSALVPAPTACREGVEALAFLPKQHARMGSTHKTQLQTLQASAQCPDRRREDL